MHFEIRNKCIRFKWSASPAIKVRCSCTKMTFGYDFTYLLKKRIIIESTWFWQWYMSDSRLCVMYRWHMKVLAKTSTSHIFGDFIVLGTTLRLSSLSLHVFSIYFFHFTGSVLCLIYRNLIYLLSLSFYRGREKEYIYTLFSSIKRE